MGRLIDADVLKRNIEEVIKKQNGKKDDLVPVGELLLFIDGEPTAYDLDSVVKELEEKADLASQRYHDCPYDSPCFERYRTQYVERSCCLEIVKGGRADE